MSGTTSSVNLSCCPTNYTSDSTRALVALHDGMRCDLICFVIQENRSEMCTSLEASTGHVARIKIATQMGDTIEMVTTLEVKITMDNAAAKNAILLNNELLPSHVV